MTRETEAAHAACCDASEAGRGDVATLTVDAVTFDAMADPTPDAAPRLRRANRDRRSAPEREVEYALSSEWRLVWADGISMRFDSESLARSYAARFPESRVEVQRRLVSNWSRSVSGWMR